MHKAGAYVAYVIAAASGLSLWVVIPALTGDPEAWSSGLYYKVGIPLLTVECALLGYFIPERWWHWGIVIALAQAIFMVFKWPTSNLLPPSLIVLFFLSTPYAAGGFLGSQFRKRFGRR